MNISEIYSKLIKYITMMQIDACYIFVIINCILKFESKLMKI